MKITNEITLKVIRRLNAIKYFGKGNIGLVTLLSYFVLPDSIRPSKVSKKIIAARAKHIGVYPDDVFLVSYPHSGRTWLTCLLANIKKPGAGWVKRNYIVPDYASDDLMTRAADISRPRIFAIHNKQRYDSYCSKIIYLYRDGRDVAVSLYKTFREKMNFKDGFKKFLKMYVKEGFNGSPSWHTHVKQHLFTHQTRPTLPVKYEDLCEDPAGMIQNICSFVGLEATPAKVEAAVKQGSFESYQEFTNNLGAKGSPGAWRNFFDDELCSFYWNIAGETLTTLGYSK